MPTYSEEQLRLLKESKRFFDFIFPPGALFEIRALKTVKSGGKDRNLVGRFLTADHILAAKATLAWNRNGSHYSVYYTINPVSATSAYARRGEQDQKLSGEPTARAPDMEYRRIYAIDVDPVRPSGTCSTDEEKAEAWKVAQAAIQYLRKRGWPEPILIDSGNGFHLLFLAERCPADAPEWPKALKYLGHRLNSLTAKIDPAISSAARVLRVPGSWNWKGDGVLPRPHRLCHVLSYPEEFLPVPVSEIAALAAEAVAAGIVTSTYGVKRSYSDEELVIDEIGVEELIGEFPDQLELGRISHEGDATYFELLSCPFKGEPHRGQSVGKGKTTIILRPCSIGFKCFSDECEGHTFVELLKLLYEQTGRRPSMPIWPSDDLEEAIAAWGGVDDVATIAAATRSRLEDVEPEPLPAASDCVSARFTMHREDKIDLEHLTFDDLVGPFRAFVEQESFRLKAPQQAAFAAQVNGILANENVRLMAQYLGAQFLEDLKYHTHPDPENDPRYAVYAREIRLICNWFDGPAPNCADLDVADMLPLIAPEALRRDANLTNDEVRDHHRHLVERLLRDQNKEHIAAYLGYSAVQAIREPHGPVVCTMEDLTTLGADRKIVQITYADGTKVDMLREKGTPDRVISPAELNALVADQF
jgi:hypothetical protein